MRASSPDTGRSAGDSWAGTVTGHQIPPPPPPRRSRSRFGTAEALFVIVLMTALGAFGARQVVRILCGTATVGADPDLPADRMDAAGYAPRRGLRVPRPSPTARNPETMLNQPARRRRTTTVTASGTNPGTFRVARVSGAGRVLVAALCGVVPCARQPSVLKPTPTHGSVTTGVGTNPTTVEGPAGQEDGGPGSDHRTRPENDDYGRDHSTPTPTSASTTPFSLGPSRVPPPLDTPQLTPMPQVSDTDQPAG